MSRLLGLWRAVLAGLSVLALLAGCDNAGEYRRKSGRWHFEDLPLQPADPAGFTPLSRHFARDGQRGYYRDLEIPDSHGASFEALSDHEARDHRHVYWAETYRKGQEYWAIRHRRVWVVDGADPAGYRPLGHGYGGDGRAVFHEGRAFTVRDAASFTVLDAQFSRDAQRGYFEREEITGSDGARFERIDPREAGYARDSRRVYFAAVEAAAPGGRPQPQVRVLQGANPATVQLLGRGYARDGAMLWWHGRPVVGADAASIVVLDDFTQDPDAQDRLGSYRQGQRLGGAAPGGPGTPGDKPAQPRAGNE